MPVPNVGPKDQKQVLRDASNQSAIEAKHKASEEKLVKTALERFGANNMQELQTVSQQRSMTGQSRNPDRVKVEPDVIEEPQNPKTLEEKEAIIRSVGLQSKESHGKLESGRVTHSKQQ